MLTPNDKYPVQDSRNLLYPIQMQLYLKPGTSSYLVVPFLESMSNLKHFETKMIVTAIFFWKLQTVKDLLRPLSKKYNFRTLFDSQHVKAFQTLVKSP